MVEEWGPGAGGGGRGQGAGAGGRWPGAGWFKPLRNSFCWMLVLIVRQREKQKPDSRSGR